MKAYQKPAMLVLSLSANDMLCSGTCTVKTKTDAEFKDFINSPLSGWQDNNKNGYFDSGDSANYFSSGDGCGSSDVEYIKYCKFSGADEGLTQLFTS